MKNSDLYETVDLRASGHKENTEETERLSRKNNIVTFNLPTSFTST